jgi:hypothetical protein
MSLVSIKPRLWTPACGAARSSPPGWRKTKPRCRTNRCVFIPPLLLCSSFLCRSFYVALSSNLLSIHLFLLHVVFMPLHLCHTSLYLFFYATPVLNPPPVMLHCIYPLPSTHLHLSGADVLHSGRALRAGQQLSPQPGHRQRGAAARGGAQVPGGVPR